jgi:hypothetical protein
MNAINVKGTFVPEIFVSKNKSRLKIYKDKNVYLKDGDNFEIEIYNNQLEKVGFEILINGKLISNSLIILRPAERVFLDRFIDENKKFLFETYKVENNQQNKDIIKNNGRVTIRCYKEKEIESYKPFVVYTPYYVPYYKPYNPYNPHYPNIWYEYNWMNNSSESGITYTTNNIGSNNIIGTSYNSSCSNISTTNCTFTTNSLDIETGRIEKGEESQQNFEYTNFDKKSTHFHEVEYFIFPVSMQEKTTENIRLSCDCGYRIRKNSWKFCPKCGKEL